MQFDLLQAWADCPREARQLVRIEACQGPSFAYVQLHSPLRHFGDERARVVGELPAQPLVRRQQSDDAFHVDLTHVLFFPPRGRVSQGACQLESRAEIESMVLMEY